MGDIALDAMHYPTYVGGLRRYRATVNNDGGAVLIWELAANNRANGGDAA
jgi:hypothetical protein